MYLWLFEHPELEAGSIYYVSALIVDLSYSVLCVSYFYFMFCSSTNPGV
jgi:hypothetical protein